MTLGCLISVIYLHVKYRGASSVLADAGTPKSGRATMKELLSIAVPITLGSAGLQIINLFDTMIYMRRLELGLGWSVEMAENLKGVYNYQQTIFALPCAFIPTITIACIPAITAALTRRELDNVRATEESAIRTMALVAMPCAAGLFAMAEPVIRLLCTSYTPEQLAVATKMLMILGVAVIFNSLVLLFNAFMQAHGDVTSPVINMFIGGIVKIAVNYVLVGIPEINIVGAPVGTDDRLCRVGTHHRAQLLCPAPLRQGKSPHFPQPDPASDRVRHHGRGHVHGLPGAADAPALRAAGVPGGAAVRGVPVPHSGRCAALHHL